MSRNPKLCFLITVVKTLTKFGCVGRFRDGWNLACHLHTLQRCHAVHLQLVQCRPDSMQKFFSRALEARNSCHCAICAPLRPGLVRKAGTLPARQAIKFGDVVTIVYGTVIGTAAYYDANSKKRRRKALNDAIAGVVSENEVMQQDQEARLKALGYNGSENGTPLDVLQSELPSIPIIQNDRRPSVVRSSSHPTRRHITNHLLSKEKREARKKGFWRQEMIARAQERENCRLEPSTKTFEFMQEAKFRARGKRTAKFSDSIFPEERIVGKTIDEAWEEVTIICNERNTRIQEISTFRLVLHLLRAYLVGVDTDREKDPRIDFIAAGGVKVEVALVDIADLMEKHQFLSRNIEQLKAGLWDSQEIQPAETMPYPKYQLYDRYDGGSSPYHEDIRLQNEKLVDVLLSAQGPKELISNMCTFLMSCSCAPNIHTINLLLIHFLDLQWFQAAKVIVSASSQFVINQNEVTDVAKLYFFHSSHEDINFDAQRAYMQAVDGRVTRAAYVPGKLTSNEWVPEQLVEQIRERNGVQTVTYGLKAAWTVDSFSIVIIDLLDRGKLSSALAEIATMRLSGFKETPEIVEALLQYSVFNSDWDIAVKTWSRSGALGHIKSPLTWYWMLQACAVCNQPQAFQRMVYTGQEEGILSSDIIYTMKEFRLCKAEQKELKKRVHAIQRLAHRISIPNMAHRNIRLQAQDFVLLPNLQQTLLVVYLQYAKLRASTCGWSFDHLNYLCQSEVDLDDLLIQLRGDPPFLKKFVTAWSGFDTKLEAIAAVCNPAYTGYCSNEMETAIERIALLDASEVELDSDVSQLRGVFDQNPPAFPYFYDMNTRQDQIFIPLRSQLDDDGLVAGPSSGLSNWRDHKTQPVLHAHGQSGVKQAGTKFEWVSGSDAMRRMVRASSNYAFARYWEKVLHPHSPTNIEPLAIVEGMSSQLRAQDEVSTTGLVSSNFERLSIAQTTTSVGSKHDTRIIDSLQLQPSRRSDDADLGQSRSIANESIVNLSRRSSKRDSRVKESPRLKLKKSGHDHHSNWTRIEHRTDALNPDLLHIPKDYSTHKITDKGDLQIHVPWQSVTQPEPRQFVEDNDSDNDSRFDDNRLPLMAVC